MILGTTAGSLMGPLKEAELLTPAAESGVTVLSFIEADGLSDRDDGGVEDLTEAAAGWGGADGRVGEDEALSVGTDASGGRHRRARCSST